MLSGSDDGNVRIWKARASDKLGIITARERAAMEYRDSLKERWKMDAEVGKVSRCVSSLHAYGSHMYGIFLLFFFPRSEIDIYPNPSTKLRNSSELCWKRGESKRSGGGNIRALERANRKQKGRVWYLWNRLRLHVQPLFKNSANHFDTTSVPE